MRQPTDQLIQEHLLSQRANQQPDAASVRWAELGHPLGHWFYLVQATFDAAYYCRNNAERYLACSDDRQEQVWLRRPEIVEAQDLIFTYQGRQFNMPRRRDGEAYMVFVDAFAQAGFPNSKAHLDSLFFTLNVLTNRADVRQQITMMVYNTPGLRIFIDDTYLSITLCRKPGGQLPPLKVFRTLFTLLKRLFADTWLPYPAEPVTLRGTPLRQRPFRPADVARVEVTAQEVLAPTLSADLSELAKAAIATDLQQLFELGYPVTPTLQDYCNQLHAAWPQKTAKAARR